MNAPGGAERVAGRGQDPECLFWVAFVRWALWMRWARFLVCSHAVWVSEKEQRSWVLQAVHGVLPASPAGREMKAVGWGGDELWPSLTARARGLTRQ